MKFKVGDCVEIIDDKSAFFGQLGRVVHVYPTEVVSVQLSDSQAILYRKQVRLSLDPLDVADRAHKADAAPQKRAWRDGDMLLDDTGKVTNLGRKDDADKLMLDLLDPFAISQLGAVLTFGAKKYAPHNWRKGIKYSRLIAALLRHVMHYLGGENVDSESGLPHIAHAMCCCMFLLGLDNQAVRETCDDRALSNFTDKR